MLYFLFFLIRNFRPYEKNHQFKVTRSDTIGGVHVYIFNLIETYKNAGYPVEVICSFSDNSPFINYLKAPGSHILSALLYVTGFILFRLYVLYSSYIFIFVHYLAIQ